jgi:hypothetical protein
MHLLHCGSCERALWLQEEKRVWRPQASFLSELQNDYKAAAYHEADRVSVKHGLAPKILREQNFILEQYIK